MTTTVESNIVTYIGTLSDDLIVEGYTDATTHISGSPIKAVGMEGNDEIIATGANDLAAGDMVGNEWTFENGLWVYNSAHLIVSNYGQNTSFDDIISTGQGDDVLLGNGGNDQLYAGGGADLINAGTGDDFAYGGNGDDIINLEDGDDFAEGGYGADIINAGDGDDVVYGDVMGENLLIASNTNATTFDQFASNGSWTLNDSFGSEVISQSTETVAGETYTISFGLAANFAGGYSAGAVEVLWNGVVVDTVQTTSGAFETFELVVLSTGADGELSFRAVDAVETQAYNFDGPIISYETSIDIGGESVDVHAFAPGQSNLYQVINGQLNVFDIETQTYVAVGDDPGFNINSIGFNAENDMIYGVAKSQGYDSLGNAVNTSDIVMIDANGATFLVGDGYYGDYVGDFDDSGNLWTFSSNVNRVSVVDVDQFDADGNPVITHYNLPNDLFNDRAYDIAYSAEDACFYAVVSPGRNGQPGKVVKIDLSSVRDGGSPELTELPITGTLYGDTMQAGMVSGAYGAVFLDGEGNLYFGLNRGDHDMNASTGNEGGIYGVEMDWDAGQAHAVFMSEAPATGSNDGAVDPRSSDAFSEVDASATVLIQEPTLTLVDGGNDDLRGGAGNDEMHGNAGDDRLHGGSGDDILFGDQGADKISGGSGDDWAAGGAGNDELLGNAGDDALIGNEGNDYLNGGTGNDSLSGGQGVDKLVGGAGADVVNGGAGDDHLWGGNWSADGSADTFVFNAGTGKDYVHDFEDGIDLIDLSSYDVTFDEVLAVTSTVNGSTVIDLSALDGGLAGDKIVLKSVDAGEMGITDFLL